jgi:hypothetical protein
MKKEKITIEQVKEAFIKTPYGEEFTRTEIVKKVTDIYGYMEIIPSDYCYNRVNKGIDIEKNLKEHRCLFEYISRNRYKYIGAGQPFNGDLFHKPKSGKEYVVGKVKMSIVEWYK